jgi:hypothetical protein
MYPSYIAHNKTVPAWLLAAFAFASGVGITLLILVCK